MEISYKPRLPNNKLAPLPWQIRLFHMSFVWPIEYEANRNVRLLDNVHIFIDLLLVVFNAEAEAHYLLYYLDDIDLVLECFATFLALIEFTFRAVHMAFNKIRLRELLKEFYLHIYIERASDPQMYAKIQHEMVPTKICCYMYVLLLLSYIVVPVIGLIDHKHLLPFQERFHYDYTPLYAYVPTLVQAIWAGFLCVTQFAGESYLLATFNLHLNARYLLLQKDLVELHSKLQEDPDYIKVFSKHLIAIIKRNVELNTFAEKMQAEYSFRVFIVLFISSLLLCTLAFKVATLGFVTENMPHIVWIIEKVIELLIFGKIGSTIIYTTDQVSSMYYFCNREEVIMTSANAKENVKLMKLLTLAMSVNREAFALNGLGFFTVSLETVVTILQCAASYFTCLYAFR